MHAIPDSDSPGASGGQGGPPDPLNLYSWNRHYGEHIITKIDPIAYMTNILFSLSFIASIYGMNLNIFNSGQVQLSQYLATAIPFCLGVFIVTFVIPGMVARMLPGKKK
jgi:formate-dependent nitrite reductase membrane component NrfD